MRIVVVMLVFMLDLSAWADTPYFRYAPNTSTRQWSSSGRHYVVPQRNLSGTLRTSTCFQCDHGRYQSTCYHKTQIDRQTQYQTLDAQNEDTESLKSQGTTTYQHRRNRRAVSAMENNELSILNRELDKIHDHEWLTVMEMKFRIAVPAIYDKLSKMTDLAERHKMEVTTGTDLIAVAYVMSRVRRELGLPPHDYSLEVKFPEEDSVALAIATVKATAEVNSAK